MEDEIRALMKALEKEYAWRFTKEEYANTPGRVKAMYDEWLARNKYDKMTRFEPTKYSGMVVLRNIKFYALCSHHLMPFFGKVSVGYIPKKKVYGASKLARIVGNFAYQAQSQERMTQEILDSIEADDVIVAVKGVHMCMTARGINDEGEDMLTESLKGAFRRAKVREEFRSLVGMQ